MAMKLNQIRDVVAIANRGSLRAAAQHLRLAQPALTRRFESWNVNLVSTCLNGMQGVCLSLRYASDVYSSSAAGACQGLLLLCRLGHLEWWHAAQSTPMSVTNYQLAPHRHRLRVNRMKLSQCVN
jgi:hypothetical protein